MMKTSIYVALVGTCAILSVNPALAQDSSQRAQGTASESSDGDIIVTAQRRDESLAKTPVAVAVLSSDSLAKAQIVSEQDLRLGIPGLAVRATLSSNQLNYSLRGQSQDAYSGTRPGVLPYFNDVQIGTAAGGSSFYDLQSVQVLKGPQGTLFGRSATGGAVLFTSAKPTDTLTGYISGLAGGYGAIKVEGALSGPIAGDNLTARIAGAYNKRNGFQRNLFDGGREGDIERIGVRGSVTANLGASFKNELVVDYLHSNSESTLGVISGLLPFTGAPGQPPFIPIEFLYAGTATPTATATGIGTAAAFVGAINPATGAVLNPGLLTLVSNFYTAYFSDPKHPAGGIRSFLNSQTANGPFIVNSDAANLYKANNISISNTSTIDIGENARIKNIFGYSNVKTDTAFEADGTPYFISSTSGKGQSGLLRVRSRGVSNELQLIGKAFGAKLDYVTGLYFSDEKLTTRQDARFFDLLLGGQTQNNDTVITNRTYAAYAQGTFALNDRGLALTAGVRYTSEKVGKLLLPTDTVRVALGVTPPPGFDYDQSSTFNRLSWQFGVQNQMDNLLIYAVTRRAYKAGGFNPSVAPRVGLAQIAGDGFEAERVTDVELGAKYQAGGVVPVRLSAALFHNWLENSQRTAYSLVLGNPASLTVSIPKGKVYGFELEGSVKPASWLTLGAIANYTESSYSGVASGLTALAGCGGATVSANGATQCFDQVPDTPKFSGALYGDLNIPVSGDVSLLLHGDVFHQSSSVTTPRSVNSNGTTMPAYTIANFRLGVENSQAGWSLIANLKNAFNRVYFVGGIPTGEIYQINTLVPGEPRTWTIEARFKF